MYMKQYFNSIKVRLEQSIPYQSYHSYQHFNSIKVRLEQANCVCIPTESNSFQFHKGTIRTFITLTYSDEFCPISIP